MGDEHEWRLLGGAGGWEVWECNRCGLERFGGSWLIRRFLAWLGIQAFRCPETDGR